MNVEKKCPTYLIIKLAKITSCAENKIFLFYKI